MFSFIKLDSKIKFEKNVDSFVENFFYAYPKLTVKKINYVVGNVDLSNGKEELIEQLISNLMEVATAPPPRPTNPAPTTPAPTANPAAPAPASPPNKTAIDIVKSDFKNTINKAAAYSKDEISQKYGATNKKLSFSYQRAVDVLINQFNQIIDSIRKAPASNEAPQEDFWGTNSSNASRRNNAGQTSSQPKAQPTGILPPSGSAGQITTVGLSRNDYDTMAKPTRYY